MDKKTTTITAMLLVAVAVAAWYLFSSIPNDRGRVDQIGADIHTARDQQQSAAERLDTIQGGLDNSASETGRISGGLGSVAETISGAAERVDTSQERIANSQQLVREGQRILAAVHKRGQGGAE